MKSGLVASGLFKNTAPVIVEEDQITDKKLASILFKIYRRTTQNNIREIEDGFNLILNFDLYVRNKNNIFSRLISEKNYTADVKKYFIAAKRRIDALCTGYSLELLPETEARWEGIIYLKPFEKGLEYEVISSNSNLQQGFIPWGLLSSIEGFIPAAHSTSVIFEYEDEILPIILEHAMQRGLVSRSVVFKPGNKLFDSLNKIRVHEKLEQVHFTINKTLITLIEKATLFSVPPLEAYEKVKQLNPEAENDFKVKYELLFNWFRICTFALEKLTLVKNKWHAEVVEEDKLTEDYSLLHQRFFDQIHVVLITKYRALAEMANFVLRHQNLQEEKTTINYLCSLFKNQHNELAQLQLDNDFSAYRVTLDSNLRPLDTYYMCANFHYAAFNDLIMLGGNLKENVPQSKEPFSYCLDHYSELIEQMVEDDKELFIRRVSGTLVPKETGEPMIKSLERLVSSYLYSLNDLMLHRGNDKEMNRKITWIYLNFSFPSFIDSKVGVNQDINMLHFEFLIYFSKIIEKTKNKIKYMKQENLAYYLGNCFEASIYNLLRIINDLTVKCKVENSRDPKKMWYYVSLFNYHTLKLILQILDLCKSIGKNNIYYHQTKVMIEQVLGAEIQENNSLDIANDIFNKAIYFQDEMINTGLSKDKELTSEEKNKIAEELQELLKLEEAQNRILKSEIEKSEKSLRKAKIKRDQSIRERQQARMTQVSTIPAPNIPISQPLAELEQMMQDACAELHNKNYEKAERIYEATKRKAAEEKNHLVYLQCVHSLAECFGLLALEATPLTVRNSGQLDIALSWYEKSNQYAKFANKYYKKHVAELKKDCNEKTLQQINELAEFITIILEESANCIFSYKNQQERVHKAALNRKRELEASRKLMIGKLGEAAWKKNKSKDQQSTLAKEYLAVTNKATILERSIADNKNKIEPRLRDIKRVLEEFTYYIGGEGHLKRLMGREASDKDELLDGSFLDRIEQRALKSGNIKYLNNEENLKSKLAFCA